MNKLILLFILFFLASCGDIFQSSNEDFFSESNGKDFLPFDLEEEIEPILPVLVPAYVPTDHVLRLAMRPPHTLNPLLNEDTTVAAVLRLLYEPLAYLDENMRITGNIVRLEFAYDFRSVIAVIHPGVLWSCGAPVTADDIIFSIETLKNAPSTAIYAANVRNITYVERVDSRAVEIFFVVPSVTAGDALTFPIIPRHHNYDMRPHGNGPFMFYHHMPLRYVRLVANPRAWLPAAAYEVEVLLMHGYDTMLHAFGRGLTDALQMPMPQWVRQGTVRQINYNIVPAMYFEFIGVNSARQIFRDPDIRRGLAHAIDICELVASLYLTHAVRAATPIHPHSWAHDDAAPFPQYNKEEAAHLLAHLIRTSRYNDPVVILANDCNPERVEIARALANGLSALGIYTKVYELPQDEYFSRLGDGDFDLYIGGVVLSNHAPFDFLFSSGGLFLHNAPTLEAAYAMRLAYTEAGYRDATARFQTVFAQQAPVVGIAFRHTALLTGARIRTTEAPTTCDIFRGAHAWQVSP